MYDLIVWLTTQPVMTFLPRAWPTFTRALTTAKITKTLASLLELVSHRVEPPIFQDLAKVALLLVTVRSW